MSDDYVYAFTNENVSSFEKLYDFSGSKILSVIGSGDQYFASLLYGAKEIILYDLKPQILDLLYFQILCFNDVII